MAERNRVTPEGEIVAVPLRALFMGNRGCLHEGREIVRAWKTRTWIVCAWKFRGRRVVQWNPGRYTPLFFHDEAVAFAAGRAPNAATLATGPGATPGKRPSTSVPPPRPWTGGSTERLDRGVQHRHEAPWRDLPDGAFVHTARRPALVWGNQLVGWTADG